MTREMIAAIDKEARGAAFQQSQDSSIVVPTQKRTGKLSIAKKEITTFG